MSLTKPISRRTMLRGMGAAMFLPWLEAMGPLRSWAASPTSGVPAPNRMAFVYVPNGKNMADWTPRGEAYGFDLPAILQPLAGVRSKLSVLTGLTADKARPHGDGGGDHARAMAAFLTGAQPRKTDGAAIRAGISVDQVAAAEIGHLTRLPSLEIGCEQGSMAGNCDSGYSCVYSSTMSWRSGTQPLPKEVNPKLVFERMFGTGADSARVERDARRRSILDYVMDDSKALSHRLGSSDNRKLDEYFASVRDIETRMDRAEKLPTVQTPDYAVPAGVPADYQEHIRLMCDMMVLAFQTDVTRVVTFVVANEGSNRAYPFIEVPEGHHDLSHHAGDESKKAKIRQINTFHTGNLAYLLERLDSVAEGDGTLLDHAMVVYGSGNSDGNRHNHDDLPILLAGGGCGTLTPGRHLRYPNETPLNNLWLAMLNRMDIEVAQLGDSTGELPNLS
ncbi:DUF1552 domain-containing protein [Candidatus Poribacteria bacterium]|nr:DUF1552 domain-containing protein [Candidatus Poribacteria bacterium]